MNVSRRVLAALLPAVVGLLLVGGLLFTAAPAMAEVTPKQLTVPADPEGNKACLECHSKNESMVRDGKTISVHVNAQDYNDSVHGILGCVRCHAEAAGPEHAKDPKKPLGLPTGRDLKILKSAGCVKCHAGVYQESYELSFHGVAVANGDNRAATCVDCHGIHNIQPARNPVSTVSQANLAGTCGTAECHEGAPANFAQGKEHFVPAKAETSGGLYWVYKGFMILILFDTMKDGPIVMFELLRRLRG